MGKAKRLGKVPLRPSARAIGTADLRNFEAVGEANAIMVAIGRDEHLSLVTKPPKGDAMHDPVAVPLENVARPARARTILRMETAAGSLGMGRDAGRKTDSAALAQSCQ